MLELCFPKFHEISNLGFLAILNRSVVSVLKASAGEVGFTAGQDGAIRSSEIQTHGRTKFTFWNERTARSLRDVDDLIVRSNQRVRNR